MEWDTYRISFEILDQQISLDHKKDDVFNKNLEDLNNLKELNEERGYLAYNWIFKLMRKFTTMSAYDYFNEREEVEKKQQKKNKKYLWKDKEKEKILKP